MITKKEVQHIAKLARLGLTPKEVAQFQKELSLILDYFEKLKEVDISEVKSEIQSVEIEKAAREDKKSSKLLELAPETKNGYLKVKSIF